VPENAMERLLERLKRIERALENEPWRKSMQELVDDFSERLEEIKTWLEPLLECDNPPLRWEPLKVMITEGGPRGFEAPGARLYGPPGRYVEIVPKARQVFNATGRADFISPKGRVVLARFAPGEWSFIWPVGDDDEWRSAKLSPTSLADVLQEMMT